MHTVYGTDGTMSMPKQSNETPGGFAYVAASNSTALGPGAYVRIAHRRGLTCIDWPFVGDFGDLLGFSVPHGWAIVRLERDGHETLVHPERLEAAERKGLK